ncbi:MAG: DHH family phosphoesterase [bacterium]|nr:DHH family phosphoesterase [bacterium]
MWDTIFVSHILKSRNFTPDEIEKYIKQHTDYEIKVPSFDKFISFLENSKSILIVGDYDVDGIVSSSVLNFILKKIFEDKKNIFVFIPNRFTHGYGLNQNTLRCILRQYKNKVDTLITVDNGISSYREIQLLREEGLRIAVIDHHRFDGPSPKAELIIHPHFFDIGYSYLCASGIVYKIALFFLNWLRNSEKLERVITFFAGLATIADVVPLLEDNRKIVKRLFSLTSKGYVPSKILKMFIRAYGKETLPTSSFHFSHIIIPRLNAPGRVDDPYVSFNLVYKTIWQTYHSIEDKIDEELIKIESINRKRQELQSKVLDFVTRNIEKKELYKNNVIVPDYVEGSGLEAGVIGIVASKIANKYKKPTFIFSRLGDILKGSVRNPIDSIDITEVIGNYRDLVLKFGGHKKAAGIEIKLENFERFRQEINLIKYKQYQYDIDLELTPFFFNKFVSYADRIVNIMEPFGEKNEKPILKLVNLKPESPTFNVSGKKVFLEYNNHYSIVARLSGISNKSIFFETLQLGEKNLHPREKIIFPDSMVYKEFYLISAKIKSLESMRLLFNSYRDFIIICKSEEYENLKNLLPPGHIPIFEKNIGLLIENLKRLSEGIFITNQSIIRGSMIFCMDFDEYFLSFRNEIIRSSNRGVIFVKLDYD